MLLKRIIPCLDLKNNLVVKGKNFLNLKSFGNPSKLAKKYYNQGADEIVLLNINRNNISNFSSIIKSVSKNVFIPITAGGNINSIEDASEIFNSGADRISLNSSLFNKNLLEQVSDKYGKQCVIASIDVKKDSKNWYVYINGGSLKTNLDVLSWVKTCQNRGAGEILLTSIDRDGTNEGFDIDLIKYVSEYIDIPLISSGGGGGVDFVKNSFDVFSKTKSNSILLASFLHYKNKNNNISFLKKQIDNRFLNKESFFRYEN